MAENQTMIFFFFLIYKKLKKACVALKKKAQKSTAKAHFYKGASLLRKKAPKVVRFAHKRTFNNIVTRLHLAQT